MHRGRHWWMDQLIGCPGRDEESHSLARGRRMVVVERDLLVGVEHADLGCRRGMSSARSVDGGLLSGIDGGAADLGSLAVAGSGVAGDFGRMNGTMKL
ncbi:hypothetical protein ACLOJK_029397 [Asimina triloba]